MDETKERVPDPADLPAVFGILTASKILGIGKNQSYAMVRAGKYPVRVLGDCGRLKVTRYDLLEYLGANRGAA